MTDLTVSEVLAAHAEFGSLDHDMVKRAMGPNWPAEWSEKTGIFESAQPAPARIGENGT